MRLVIRPAASIDHTFSYAVKRAALGGYVAQVWGWDEQVQQAIHASDWATHKPDVIEIDGVAVGTIEVVEHRDHIYVGEFYLLPEYQRRGIGTAVLAQVLTRADAVQLPVRLQFLKVNPVRSLYERVGFRVTSESPTHYVAERRAPRHRDE